MEENLADIINGNPWSILSKILIGKEHCLNRSTNMFVLPCDEQILIQEQGYYKDELKLVLSLPPQPFIGNPRSKIWIVQFNPGYSEGIDEFDLLGIDDGSIPKLKKIETDYRDRLKLLCGQYTLASLNHFYPLHSSFNTMKAAVRGKGCGIHLWYNRSFFPSGGLFDWVRPEQRCEFAGENIFVLELFPYHSRRFGHNFFPFLPSFEYTKRLLGYAMTHEKLIICFGLHQNASLTSSVLRCLPGFRTCLERGYVYEVMSAMGRSRLRLCRNNIKSFNRKISILDDCLDGIHASWRSTHDND